ncbi:MAG TPA: HAD family phosphatase [Chthoniobacteraceae bacterium]|nr:HAD family phosphatase [Chthoniobacteraceae bacterium]
MKGNWGAIFDWDGVVIDSSRQHEESWERLAREVARPLPEGHFKAGFGRKNEFIIPQILQWETGQEAIHRLSLRKEALYREIVREGGLEPLPGVKTWLERLAAAGIPCAVGSSTHRENIEVSLDVLGLREYFRAIVSSEDVSHGKPDPEVFLKAGEKIGVPPERCVVFEDAHVGIEAAHRAGMRVIAVATTNPLGDLGVADRAVERLDELTVEAVGAWFP